MEKNKKNEFFSIGKAAKMIDIATHTVRFWQKQFPQITPKIGKGKRKYYNLDAINQFKQIKTLMYDRGMKIAGIQKIMLSEATDKDIQYTIMPISAEKSNSIADLLSWSQVNANQSNDNIKEKVSFLLEEIEKIKNCLNKIK